MNQNIATNYVLDKLAAAGIEVITDKAEFDRILESEKLLQKMVRNYNKLFDYEGFHFLPVKKCDKEEISFITENFSWKGAVLHQPSNGQNYSHDGFYEAANSDAEIFYCVEKGCFCIPADTGIASLNTEKKLQNRYNKEVETFRKQNEEFLGSLNILDFDSKKDKQLLLDMAAVLEIGDVFFRKNETVGDVKIREGSKNGLEANGLIHVIKRRMDKLHLHDEKSIEDALKETTAIAFCAINNIDKYPAIKEINGTYAIYKNGIKTVLKQDKNGAYLVTGFDIDETKKEATETIAAVIANYGYTPEFHGIYAQVGAVYASLNQNISQTQTKSSNISEILEKGFIETKINENTISLTSLKTEILNKNVSIRSASDAVKMLSHVKNQEQEHFGVILLDSAHQIKAINTVTVGTLNNTLVHAREVFSDAIKQRTKAIILFHNHPSGSVFPSKEDLDTTKNLLKASKIVGIPVLDHIIVSKDNYYSFEEHGIMNNLQPTSEFFIQNNQTYGFTHNGKIYLNPEIMNSNVAVHEYTHLWDKYIQNTNQELWQKGKDILSKTHLWEEVKSDPNYADIAHDDDLVLSEVHSRICGELAQKVLEKIAEQDGEITKDKVIDWDKETWEYLSNELLTEQDKEILLEEGIDTISSFVSLSLKDLIEAKEISLSQKKETNQLELKSDNPKERVKEITDMLEKGVTDIFNSEKYQEYLTVMSKFHKYSTNNIRLIALQNPDATLVAGFQSWKKDFERTVKKGERGIKILVPIIYKVKDKQQIEQNAEENQEIEKEKQYITFKIGHVFDVAQTEGKELPTLGVNELTGNVEQFKEIYKALEKISPYPIFYENIISGAKGYCDFMNKKIAINTGMSEAQTLKTLIHEISHAKLHGNNLVDRETSEVQAESVAYTVCKHFGLDTADYSFAYVTSWSSSKDAKELKESLETIRKTSVEFIENIEQSLLKEITQEKEKEFNPIIKDENFIFSDSPNKKTISQNEMQKIETEYTQTKQFISSSIESPEFTELNSRIKNALLEYKTLVAEANKNPENTAENFPKQFMYIKEQTPQLCSKLVAQNEGYFKYVTQQTEENCLAAIQANPAVISFIEKPTEEMNIAAVKGNGYLLKEIDNPSSEVCLTACQNNGLALQFIAEPTPEMCMAAVTDYGSALRFVKEQSKDICMAAVQNDVMALKYVKEPNIEICSAAVKQDKEAWLFVPEKIRNDVAASLEKEQQQSSTVYGIAPPEREMEKSKERIWTPRNDCYQSYVTDLLNTGTASGKAPFLKTWKPGQLNHQYNPTTGQLYDPVILGTHKELIGSSDNRWLSASQINELGLKIKDNAVPAVSAYVKNENGKKVRHITHLYNGKDIIGLPRENIQGNVFSDNSKSVSINAGVSCMTKNNIYKVLEAFRVAATNGYGFNPPSNVKITEKLNEHESFKVITGEKLSTRRQDMNIENHKQLSGLEM